jgi:hypothetical protein
VASPIVTPAMSRKARDLAELLSTCSRGRSKLNGQPFYVVPSSNRLSAHWTAVDGSGCTCQGFQRRGTCTHAIAAGLVAAQQAEADAAQRRAHESMYPSPKRRPTYADLFPKCRTCHDIAESRDGYCDSCASTREHEARMASTQTARSVEPWL